MSTPEKIHYCSIYVMVVSGFYVASYGPLIPFYSKTTQFDQTYFSFIFLVRSIANILGGFLIKYLFKVLAIKPLVLMLTSSLALSLLACSFSPSTLNLIVTLFIASISLVMLSIVIISFNFTLFPKDIAQKQMQFLGFMFGVGAFLGPFVIIFLQLASYQFLALSCLVLLGLYWSCQLPQVGGGEQTTAKNNIISKKSEWLICSLMLIYATQEIGMSSWIPTYAVKAGVSDIDHSGVYSMLFWLPNCIFRLLWIYIPLTFHAKLKIIIYSVAVTTAIALLLQSMGGYQAVCIFGPISSGILLSNLYAFFLALPSQSGYQFTGSNTANFVIANCLGEGLFITPIGYSIHAFGFKSLIVIECVLGLIMCCVYYETMLSLQRKNEEDTSIRLLQNQF